MVGHPIPEGVPQLSPAIMVGVEVSTVTGSPARKDWATQSAVRGSTVSRAAVLRATPR